MRTWRGSKLCNASPILFKIIQMEFTDKRKDWQTRECYGRADRETDRRLTSSSLEFILCRHYHHQMLEGREELREKRGKKRVCKRRMRKTTDRQAFKYLHVGYETVEVQRGRHAL